MINQYVIPSTLDQEIDQLELLINRFKKAEVSPTELKARRVPFGVYEQRELDTYMVRIRCAAGIVSPFQLAAVGLIAKEFGRGDLHVTSRQELQIHYVKLDDLITVIRKLKEAGLSTRGGGGNTVRNVAAADDAGIDPDEVFDVEPYAVALTTRLITEGDSWTLPRKYKIAFSGSAVDKGHATLADLGFIARVLDDKKGFRVYIAGGLGAKSAVGNLLFDFVDETKVYLIAKAVKNLFSKYGNRKNKHAARLRFLWQSLGEEEFRKRLQDELDKIELEGYLRLAVVYHPEESPIKTFGGKLYDEGSQQREILHQNDSSEFILWKKRFVKYQKQSGLYSILLPIELGFLSCDKTMELAEFLQGLGDDVLRMTRDQNYLLRNIQAERLEDVYSFLNKTLPSASRPALLGKILSCAGASTCQLGICLSRQAAKVLIKELASSGLDLDKIEDIRLNISGCPNACGHHPSADLGFSGKVLRKDGFLYPGYNVYAGAVVHDGKTKLAQMLGDVPARNLPSLVKDVFVSYLSKESRVKTFRDYIADEGKEDIRRILSRYKEIPSFDDDKNYYYDWGAQKIFSLAERGTGECSAGLYDLIEVDLNNIRQTRTKLSTDIDNKERLLGDLVLFASRALLISRGVEPKNDQELYEAFREHFITAGHIDPSFTELTIIAQRKEYGLLVKKEEQVISFTQAIESLYQSMDNSFNFKQQEVLSKKFQVIGQDRKGLPPITKDLRGVICPLNFAKTKVELARLNSGDLLEIWLDDGKPIENVPGSVLGEGHKIIAQEKLGEYWKVIIEKK